MPISNPKKFPVEQVKAALMKVQPRMTDRQMLMLREHYLSETVSTGRLAEIAGYRGGCRIANIQYGTLCSRIAAELGYAPPRSWIRAIASGSGKPDAHGHFQWEMNKVVTNALKELDWFHPSKSEEKVLLPKRAGLK